MATTINTWLKKVKLIQAKTLSELEAAVNAYITGLEGEYAMDVDIDVTTVRDAPQPTSLYVATVSVVGTTTTE